MAKSSWSVLDDTVTERADIWWFGSTLGYNVPPYYQLLESLHVIDMLKKLASENGGEIMLIMMSSICKVGSPSCGGLESCYFSSW